MSVSKSCILPIAIHQVERAQKLRILKQAQMKSQGRRRRVVVGLSGIAVSIALLVESIF